jgi:hypothetical protein
MLAPRFAWFSATHGLFNLGGSIRHLQTVK